MAQPKRIITIDEQLLILIAGGSVMLSFEGMLTSANHGDPLANFWSAQIVAAVIAIMTLSAWLYAGSLYGPERDRIYQLIDEEADENFAFDAEVGLPLLVG